MLIKLLLSFITFLSFHNFNQNLFTRSAITPVSQEKSFFHFTIRKETKNLKKTRRTYSEEETSMFLAQSYRNKRQKIEMSALSQNFLNLEDSPYIQRFQIQQFFIFEKLNKGLIFSKQEEILLSDFSLSFFSEESQKADSNYKTFSPEIPSLEESSLYPENSLANKSIPSGPEILQMETTFSLLSPQKENYLFVPLEESDSTTHERKEIIPPLALELFVPSASPDQLKKILVISPPNKDMHPTQVLGLSSLPSVSLAKGDHARKVAASKLILLRHSTLKRTFKDDAPLDTWQKYKGHIQAIHEGALRQAGLTPISSPLKAPAPSDHGYDPASYRQWGSSKSIQPATIHPFILFLEKRWREIWLEDKRHQPRTHFIQHQKNSLVGRDQTKNYPHRRSKDHVSAAPTEQSPQNYSTLERTFDDVAPLDTWQKYKGHTQAIHEGALRQVGLTPISSPLQASAPSDHGYDPASYRRWGSSKSIQPATAHPFILFLEEKLREMLQEKRKTPQHSAHANHKKGLKNLESFWSKPRSSRHFQKKQLQIAAQKLKNEVEEIN